MDQLSNSFVMFLAALGDWLILIAVVVTLGMMAWVVQRRSEAMALAAVLVSGLAFVVWAVTGEPGILGGISLALMLGAIYQAIREDKVQP